MLRGHSADFLEASKSGPQSLVVPCPAFGEVCACLHALERWRIELECEAFLQRMLGSHACGGHDYSHSAPSLSFPVLVGSDWRRVISTAVGRGICACHGGR